jgi:hypothetical protein
MSAKKTLVVGASPDESRYSNLACRMLAGAGFEFIPVGIKKGDILGKAILDLRQKPDVPDVHTITLYLGASNQTEWYEYLLSLKPKRIIFNPGAENPAFMEQAENMGVEVLEACNLVMIRTGQF